MLCVGAKGDELGLVVNNLKDGVLKNGDNQVKEFVKYGVVDARNGEGVDKFCEDR